MHRNLSFIFVLVVSHWLYGTLLSSSLTFIPFTLASPLSLFLSFFSTHSLHSLSPLTCFAFLFSHPSFSSFFLFNNTSFTGVCHRFLRVETTWRDKHTRTHTGQCSTKHNGGPLEEWRVSFAFLLGISS